MGYDNIVKTSNGNPTFVYAMREKATEVHSVSGYVAPRK